MGTITELKELEDSGFDADEEGVRDAVSEASD